MPRDRVRDVLKNVGIRTELIVLALGSVAIGCAPNVGYSEGNGESPNTAGTTALTGTGGVTQAGSGGFASAGSGGLLESDDGPTGGTAGAATGGTETATGGTDGSDPLASCSDVQIDALEFMIEACYGCHGSGSSGGIGDVTDLDYLTSEELVFAGDSAGSPLITSLASMPLGSKTEGANLDLMVDWVDRCFDAEGDDGEGSEDEEETEGFETKEECLELEEDAIAVLRQACYPCHNPYSYMGGVGDVTDLNYMLGEDLLVPGDSSDSVLVQCMDYTFPKPMPPSTNGSSDDKIQKVADWVDCL